MTRAEWERKNTSRLADGPEVPYVQAMDKPIVPPNLHISDHPLVAMDMTILRDADTAPRQFREAVRRIARVLVLDATADLETRSVTVSTPLESTDGCAPARPVILVPILRAGLGMLDGVHDVLPESSVGHIGLYRDESTLEALSYYEKFPRSLNEAEVFLLDPMLATGGSAVRAIRTLHKAGARRITLLVLVAAPQGVEAVHKEQPDLSIFCAALDRGLNDRGYILPGLGDAGDRLFGTV